jgi:hypothetical protein
MAMRPPGWDLDRGAETEDAIAAVHPHHQRSRHDLMPLGLQRMDMRLRRKSLRPAHDLVLEQLPARLRRRLQEDDAHPERRHVEDVSGLHCHAPPLAYACCRASSS